MKHIVTFLTSALFISNPLSASAEAAFSGDVTLGYSSSDLEGLDFGTLSLNIDSNVRFSDQFDTDLSFGLSFVDLDGIPVDFQFTRIGIAPRYHFGNGFSAGIYYSSTNLDIDAGPSILSALSPSIEDYGLTFGYETTNWGIEGFVGVTDVDPLAALIGLDGTSFGVTGHYDISDRFSIGGHFTQTHFSITAGSIDVTSVGLAAVYDFDNNLSVYGGLQQQWFDEFGLRGEAMEASIGVAYTLDSISSVVPVTFSLEVARTDLELSGGLSASGDLDEIRLGVSIPLGGGRNSVPLNSSAHSIMSNERNSVGRLLARF